MENTNPNSDDHFEIIVDDLHKSFGSHPVLSGVNLKIRRGELVAVVGGSGCGKTVLLKAITGHFAADSGHVLIADHEAPNSPLRDVAKLSADQLDQLRVHWAVVFQRNALLSGTVYFNLAFWPKEIKNMTDAPVWLAASTSELTSPFEILSCQTLVAPLQWCSANTKISVSPPPPYSVHILSWLDP